MEPCRIMLPVKVAHE